MLRLRFLVDGRERTVALSGTRVRLGRGADNDVVLGDVSVSRHHAELRRGEEGWSVHDLMSTNGVEVNRVPVKTAPLDPGDRLGIGVFELLVEGEADSPPVAPPIPFPSGRTVAPPEAEGLGSLANATIIRPLAAFAAEYGLTSPVPAGEGTRTASVAARGGQAGEAGEARDAGDGYANRMFGFLTRLGQVLLTADSVDAVFTRMLDIAFEALPVERGFILLRDEAGELLCELARVKQRVQRRPQGEVPVSRTMLQAVMRERVALVTYDAMTDQRLSGGESIRLHQIRAAMCAPLWSGESIIGVVQLDSPFKVGAFNERDLDVLTALANSVAVAVERIRSARRADRERQVRSRLERYHSPAVIEEVLREDEPEAGESGEGLRMGVRRPRSAEASVLFADLVGFTSFSEKAPPEAVADLLDAFLSLAVEAIFEVSGTLDKFIGDCVMAFFGAPVPQADHALRAVKAAVEIQRRLAAWGVERAAQGLPAWSVRIAVNSGPVLVGDIGSRRRVDYTVLGNTVNVAARLEAFVARPGDVVLGPETHRLLAGAIPTESLGDFQLKGLERKIVAYRVKPEVLGLESAAWEQGSH